jgi:hypothetical protein
MGSSLFSLAPLLLLDDDHKTETAGHDSSGKGERRCVLLHVCCCGGDAFVSIANANWYQLAYITLPLVLDVRPSPRCVGRSNNVRTLIASHQASRVMDVLFAKLRYAYTVPTRHSV